MRSDRPRLALASRGDALTPHLYSALRRRFPAVDAIDTELTYWQRYGVAALTFRPSSRSGWVERFYKSEVAVRLRSVNAAHGVSGLAETPDIVVQVHALFSLPKVTSALYIDCTHAQSAALWPAWNPLTGRALRRWYDRERSTYESAQHLFAFSEATRASLVHDYGIDQAKVTVTGAGVNFAGRMEPSVDGRLRRVEQPTILFVGNDFVRKGGPVLLKAFARVRDVLPEARLQLVGVDADIRPQAGVEVLGRIRDRERIRSLYGGATIFALPSLYDPYPLAVLEAMSFGLPVITTRQMGAPEMITTGTTGLLTEPGDADGLTDALLRLLADHDEATRLGTAARRDVEARFTWDAVVDRMVPALDYLASVGR